MVKRRQANVDTRVTRHKVYDDGNETYREGDALKVRLPGSAGKQTATFRAYVVPDNGVPYVDVADKLGLSRCIRPSDILGREKVKTRRRRKS